MKVFKRSLAAAVAAIVVFSNVCCGSNQPLIGNPNTVSAASNSEEMEYGDYLSYRKFDEDEDGTYDGIIISKCDKSAVSVKIPSEIDGLPVTEIGFGAYTENTKNEAFYGCKSLKSVEIPNSVTYIGQMAFSGCESLKSVVIPDSVTEIGSEAFYGTPLLENQTGVIKYADKWVVDCDRDVVITEAKIKFGTKGMANGAFSGCESLKSVEIPDSVTYIGQMAFSGCESLKSVVIPDSVTEIGSEAFYGTPLLENQTGVIKYADKWVVDCDRDVVITEAKIKFGTKGMANGAFSGCESLKSVEIPDSVTEIGIRAFYNTGLTSVEIPDSVTHIGSEAFGCTSLTSIVIPNSVTSIGYGAFFGCINLASITIKNPECKIYNSSSTIHNGYGNFTITIYGYENSTAQAFAEEWGYKFKSLDEKTPVTTTLIGDISGSGKIDLSDAIIIAQFILGKITFTDEEKVIADINKDGRINLLDAIEIASYILQDMKK